MSRYIKSFLIVALLSGFFAGCGGNVEETYIMTSVREATRGDLLSPGLKYGFDNPRLIAVYKNMALVREGNLIEFFVGEDLENSVEKVGGRRFVLGARKLYNPFIHFTVDFFAAGGDSIKVYEPYNVTYPALLARISTDEFEDVDIEGITWSTPTLKDIFHTKFTVKEVKVVYEEIPVKDETEWVYTLHLPNVHFIIDNPSDDLVLVLKALINENLYFDGGVSYGGRPSETKAYRKKTMIGGKVKIEFVKYGNKVLNFTI